MKQYDRNKPLFAIHIPKTAGTSFREILKVWYGKKLLLHYRDAVSGSMPVRYPELRDGEGNGSSDLCIFGHFTNREGLGIEEYYPRAEQFLTLWRDPFEIAVSTYFFVHKVASKWKHRPAMLDQSLAEYLRDARVNINAYLPFELDSGNYKEILGSRFIYVGLAERYEQSVSDIAGILGFDPPREISVLNSTSRHVDVPYESKLEFMKRHELEYEIYEWLMNRRI